MHTNESSWKKAEREVFIYKFGRLNPKLNAKPYQIITAGAEEIADYMIQRLAAQRMELAEKVENLKQRKNWKNLTVEEKEIISKIFPEAKSEDWGAFVALSDVLILLSQSPEPTKK